MRGGLREQALTERIAERCLGVNIKKESPMTVGELKKRLAKVKDDLPVVFTVEPLSEESDTMLAEVGKIYVDTDEPECLAIELVESSSDEEDEEEEESETP